MNSESLSYEDYLEGTRKILDESRKQIKTYTVSVADEVFIVLPNVFSPKYFHDTNIFAENLSIHQGEDFLEIGPGTGAISIVAAKRGARKVLSIDINPSAVRNTQLNIEKHRVGEIVEVRHGNVFEPLSKDEKFDVIFWNTPFGFIDHEDISDIEKSVFDPKYESTECFIQEAKVHLKPNGRVLIGFSTTLGRLDLLKQYARNAGFVLSLNYETESTETYPVKFEIFEAK